MLRGHVNRIAELTINVLDLERSGAFYEALTPLRVLRRPNPPPQAFAALGVDQGSSSASSWRTAAPGSREWWCTLPWCRRKRRRRCDWSAHRRVLPASDLPLLEY